MSARFPRLRALVSMLSPWLIFGCAASVIFMGLASEEPYARNELCGIGICFYSGAAGWWNKIIYDLSAGTLISIVFFWILVRWPEQRKKARLKRSFAAQYSAFKLDIIKNFLLVADGSYNNRLPEKLISQQEFRSYFKQNVGDGQTRWQAVANRMTDYYLDVTLLRMEVLRQEISFVVHNTDIDDEKVMAFFKRLSDVMHMQRNAAPDYDPIKPFLRFFWELFAGWDSVEGYRNYDIVEEMIEFM